MQQSEWLKNKYCSVKEIRLQDGERIIGVKSAGRGFREARHYDL